MTVAPETAQRTRLASLVPMAHVADVRKAVEFYQLLGFEVKNTVEHEGDCSGHGCRTEART